ncbi:MAG: hypothetical protein ACD_54C01067G0001 [uncultured bacterium]|nr:MAG: hypothetical protein ACD_54C01067G0001 [uncultured bacterium]
MGAELCSGGLCGGGFLIQRGEGVIGNDDFHGVPFR